MSERTTSQVQEQVEQAAQVTEEQQQALMEEARKELSLVVKALRSGNRENAVSQSPVFTACGSSTSAARVARRGPSPRGSWSATSGQHGPATPVAL